VGLIQPTERLAREQATASTRNGPVCIDRLRLIVRRGGIVVKPPRSARVGPLGPRGTSSALRRFGNRPGNEKKGGELMPREQPVGLHSRIAMVQELG
jgi:hypothetical protein